MGVARVQRLELAAHVFEVVLSGWLCEEFLNDGDEVPQRTNRSQRSGLVRAEGAAGHGQHEGVFDGTQGNVALMEFEGQLAILRRTCPQVPGVRW